MTEMSLAEQIIDAGSDTERRRLLTAEPNVHAGCLSDEIRELCIASWSSDPSRVRRAAAALKTIYRSIPSDQALANYKWTDGIAAITRGYFEKAVDRLDVAIAAFARLGRVVEAARVQVSKLLALAMLSRYDEAVQTGIAAIPILVESGDQLTAGKIEMNLSNIVSRRGKHAEAEGYCASARKRFILAAEPSWQAMAENGLANTYAELNDFDRAARFYEAARSTAVSAGMLVTEAEVEASMGNLALFRGRYGDALRHLELSRRKFEMLDMPHQTAIAELEIADIYAELNLNFEAVEIYRRVCDELRRLKLRAEESRARLNHARAAFAAGDAKAAKRELGRALRLFEAERNDTGLVTARLEAANLALQSGDADTALENTAIAFELLERIENPRLALTAGIISGQAHAKTGQYERAAEVFRRVIKNAVRLRQPDVRQRALTFLGELDAAAGNVYEAEHKFKTAIRIVEDLRAPLASEEFGMAFMAARLRPFETLAKLYLEQDRIRDAFRVVESGRSRSLADSIGRGKTDKDADGLERRLEVVREELNTYYKRLDRADPDEAAELRIAVDQREDQIDKLTRQISSVAGGGVESVGRRFSAAELMRQLGRTATLVEFVEIDGYYSAFVAHNGHLRFFRGLASTDEVAEALGDLHFQFGTMRYGYIARFAEQMRSRADIRLKKLYDLLIAPIDRAIGGGRLVFIPAGTLNYVPFHALFDGERYLVERFEISYAPSSAVWARLGRRNAGPKDRGIKRALLMGYADERIPLVEHEIKTISRIIPKARAYVGEKATVRAFDKHAAAADIIHLACHGQFRPESPMFSSLHLADGRVTVRDVSSKDLSAELVVLSACETGLSKVFAGDELLGLARGFIAAGVGSLIVSLWAVNDTAAERLMTDLYTDMQRGGTPAASLRHAQLLSVSRGDHPFLWSPFILIGR
ncbi:MAG: CHAT domain-containing protein [Pyrinomonadaceae bacterium]|nr:CHAT domain-containing protein [Pyrinomonadaceae bacterium]